jgi:uncharacterized membrane protein
MNVSRNLYSKKNTAYSGGNLFTLSFFENRNSFLLICLPVGILLTMAVPFSERTYWDDELFSILTSKSWTGMINIFNKYENNMTFYYVILYLWMNVFGEGEFATRMLSLLFSVLTIFSFFALARIFFNKTTSFFASLLLVSHPIFLLYAVETRSYSLLLLIATLATFVFIKLLSKPEPWLSALYGILIATSVYTHYFGLLLIPIHAVALLYCALTRKHIITFFFSIIGALILMAPLILFPPQSTAQINWMHSPSIKYFLTTVMFFFGGKYIFLGLVICMFFIFRYWNFKNVNRIDNLFLPVLSVSWVAIPFSLIFLVSVFIKPVFLDRYFIWCLPASVFIVCMIICNLAVSRTAMVLIFTLPVFILLVQSYQKLLPKGSGYKEAALFLSKEVNNGDAVISYPFFRAAHFSFYLSKVSGATAYAIPKQITGEEFLPGGGGSDPDPDIEMIEGISKSAAKIFVICHTGKRESDQRQNRTWLPEIEKVLSQDHHRKKEFVFGENLTVPVRILVFE